MTRCLQLTAIVLQDQFKVSRRAECIAVLKAEKQLHEA